MHNQMSHEDTAVLPSSVLPQDIVAVIHVKHQDQNYRRSAIKVPDKGLVLYERVK